MTIDGIHTTIGLVALALLATGAAIEWGAGYACLVVGATLLSAVIYARTR